MKRVITKAAICFLLLAAHYAGANTCNIVSASMPFGSYDPFSTTAKDVPGTIRIHCNKAVAIDVVITSGSGTFSQRRMSSVSSGGFLNYNLYTDTYGGTIWGDGNTTSMLHVAPSDFNGIGDVTLTVFGRIPASQPSAAANDYQDTLTVQIYYGGKIDVFGNMLATASVISSCSVSANSLTFPPVGLSLLSSYLDQTTTITYRCSNGTPTNPMTATITLGQGANPAAGSSDAAPRRQMKSTNCLNQPCYLRYDLYRGGPGSIVWGNTSTTGYSTGPGDGTAHNVAVYGRIPVQATVATGDYTDTVVVTITY